MIQVAIPHNFVEERKYVLNVLLNEYLGVDYQVSIENRKDTRLSHFDGSVIIKDYFCVEGDNYLHEANIPKNIIWNKELLEDSFPILFGENKVDNVGGDIISSIDVFSSSFFMLTRWEEFVCTVKDDHNRFPFNSSLAQQFGFNHLPIVNQYTEVLWKFLLFTGYYKQRKKYDFKLVCTHDVDIPLKWMSVKNLLGRFRYGVSSKKKINFYYTETKQFIKSKLGIEKDPFDTFDFLMDQSEKVRIKSYFFFMDYGHTKYDKNYKIESGFVQDIIENITLRDHFLGVHPSYLSGDNEKSFNKSIEEIEAGYVVNSLKAGRQHYLRLSIPQHWRNWESAKMDWDSSLGFAEEPGFRCGTCLPFPVFDVEKRVQLDLFERPLIFMEQSSMSYLNESSEEMLQRSFSLMETVKKYNGEFVLLWHNSSFNNPDLKGYEGVYESILEYYEKISL